MYGSYIFLGIIAFVGSMLIQWWLRSTYEKWMKTANASGLTGRDAALAILDANGVSDVKVEPVKGMLTDHYDPTKKVVRLSEANYSKPSVAGMAVAAHEVGHALQHAKGYAPLAWRTSLLPVASIGSQWGPMLAVIGLFLGGGPNILLTIGIWLFAGAVLFHIVTLPIEFNASHRALAQLNELGIVTEQDAGGARSVLTAAAMTYVAAAATAIMYLVYFIMASRR